MFSQVSVCPQGWGGVHPLPDRHLPGADTTPAQKPLPIRQTPPCKADPPRDTTLGRHPPTRQTPLADTPSPGRHPLGTHSPWANTLLPGRSPMGRHTLAEMATEANDTYPTGMHSCCRIFHFTCIIELSSISRSCLCLSSNLPRAGLGWWLRKVVRTLYLATNISIMYKTEKKIRKLRPIWERINVNKSDWQLDSWFYEVGITLLCIDHLFFTHLSSDWTTAFKSTCKYQ